MKNIKVTKESISLLAGGILVGMAISKGISKIKQMIVKEDNTNSEEYNNFKSELLDAISKYSEDNIDIMKDENNMIYGMYHSKHDSHPVTSDYPLESFPKNIINNLCKELNISYCED